MACLPEPRNPRLSFRRRLLVHGHADAIHLQRPVHARRLRNFLEAAVDLCLGIDRSPGKSKPPGGADRHSRILRLHPVVAGRYDGDGSRYRSPGDLSRD